MECAFGLIPTIREYAWGKGPEKSLVYKLFRKFMDEELALETDKGSDRCFSELWIGDDHSGSPLVFHLVQQECTEDNSKIPPSNVKEYTQKQAYSGAKLERLSDVLNRINLELSGNERCRFNILLKVLSIARPLSLQMHPDEKNAIMLFESKQKSIVDRKDKPEMCIALGNFEAIAGPRPLAEILYYLDKYKEFSKLVGDEIINEIKMVKGPGFANIYGKICRRLLLESPNSVNIISSLTNTIKHLKNIDLTEKYVLILYENYGFDTCILSPFILNCIEMREGDALFIPPNTLHSYISGDCIEIMKNSDNVIRCGLTNKFKDPKTCVGLHEYELAKHSELRQMIEYIKPEMVSNFVRKYQPAHPTCNFTVWSIHVTAGKMESILLSSGDCLFIGIIIETNPMTTVSVTSELPSFEEGTKSAKVLRDLEIGSCFLFCPCTRLEIANLSDCDEQFKMYISSERQLS